MALDAAVSQSGFDSLPDHYKSEYEKRSGDFYKPDMYYLKVNRVEGFALEPVDGLKSALQTERQRILELKSRIKGFDGIEPEKAREALSKYEELANADPEGKAKQIAEAQIAQITKKHANELSSHESKIESLKTQLKNELIVAAATKSLAENKGNVDLLLPLITQRTRIAEVEMDGNVRLVPRVMNDSGQDAISQKPGSTDPMGISELVESMKSDPKYQAAFLDTITPGNDIGEGSRSGITMKSGKKTISRDDSSAFLDNLDKIASGEIEVVD